MRVLFWIGLGASGLITIASFILTNIMTATFDPNNPQFGVNAGLMFIVLPILFILLFFFQLIFVFEKLHNKYAVDADLFKSIYLGLFGFIVAVSAFRIIQLKGQLAPYYEHDVSYLNPYSNHLFFNVWTFIACVCLSALCSFYTQIRPKPLQPKDWEQQ